MEENDIFLKARAGDKEAREQFIEDNIGLVGCVVKRFLGRGYENEDLFQIGCIGLIKAMDRFDMSYDVKFSTYAIPMITGEIKRFLRDDGMIKVSRSIKENERTIRQVSQRISQEKGRDATVDEIAAATELSHEDIVFALEAGGEVDTIYRTIFPTEGKEVSMVEQVVASESGSCLASGKGVGSQIASDGSWKDEEKEKVIDHMLLKQLLDLLEPKERQIIEMRYFREMTQSQIAKIMGTSQVQISRMEKKILKMLRENV